MKRTALQRKTPMRRAISFGRDCADGQERRAAAARLAMQSKAHAVRAVMASSTVFNPQPKEPEKVEHEGYRRLVAALPCIRCGIASYSQAAHPNVGKTKGEKADDRECFPLCCDRPMIVGCHYLHDQHKLFARGERRDVEQDWGAQTRAAILDAGSWPKNLPRWEKDMALA